MVPEQWEQVLWESGYRSIESERCKQIMGGIIDGVDIEFMGNRELARFGDNLPIDEVNRKKVDDIIKKDIREGKKAGPFEWAPFPFFVVSPIGAVPKKTPGKSRVIHHLSFPFKGASVNADIVDEYLPLQRFADAAWAVVALGNGCFLVKLDVEAAYKQVPVRIKDWPLLGFMWEGKYYYERVLPFGLKSSCRIWDWYASALHHFFEKMNLGFIIHYIDDFLFVVKSREEAEVLKNQALQLCERLGIPMASDKTEGPVQCLTFLGIELDTINMEARLPAIKLAEIQQLTSDWLGKSKATAKELQSLAGVLTFAASVVRPGRFFVSSLFKMAAKMKAANLSRFRT